jgi:hypothetical protein
MQVYSRPLLRLVTPIPLQRAFLLYSKDLKYAYANLEASVGATDPSIVDCTGRSRPNLSTEHILGALLKMPNPVSVDRCSQSPSLLHGRGWPIPRDLLVYDSALLSRLHANAGVQLANRRSK